MRDASATVSASDSIDYVGVAEPTPQPTAEPTATAPAAPPTATETAPDTATSTPSATPLTESSPTAPPNRHRFTSSARRH
ncbi:MAG: hypothetical protein R2911_20235 [Caldilineaceae bacterium]